MLLIHVGDDGRRAADGLVAHADGLHGLNIGQTVVVDDLEDLGLLEPGHGLRQLIVVNEHDALAPRTQEVIARERADDLFVLVEHGVAAVAALEHDLTHVVDVIIEVEADQILRVARAGDRDRLIHQPRHAAGIERGGDDAGLAGVFKPRGVDVGLAEDDALHADVERAADHIRLVAAENDAVGVGEEQVVAALRQGDRHHAGHAVDLLGAVVEDAPLDDAQEVEQRQRVHVPVADRAHAVGRDVAGGEHAVERAVLVDDGHGRDVLVAHDVPGAVHCDGGVERRRGVVVQVAHLRAHVAQHPRRLEAEAVEQALCLVADVAEVCGHIVAVTEGIAQRGIGDGGHHGVRVRVPVAGDVNLIHEVRLL